jgi:hypothetical protein
MSEPMIHPETGAILRRRKRMETVTYQGQSRTVEVEGWFPDDGGDGLLVGADSKPLDDALAEMKCGYIPGYSHKLDAETVASRYSYLGPCLTPAEVESRVSQARRDALEEAAKVAKDYALKLEDMAELSPYPHIKREHEGRSWVAQTIAAAIRALSDTPSDTYISEAEQERDEFFNRLGRVTEELRLPMDATASRIIEAVRERVDNEREACASVSVKVEVPEGAENWTPLEAWEEALLVFDEAFRDAIRGRALKGEGDE